MSLRRGLLATAIWIALADHWSVRHDPDSATNLTANPLSVQ